MQLGELVAIVQLPAQVDKKSEIGVHPFASRTLSIAFQV